MPTIGIIVLNWQQPDITIKSIRSLLQIRAAGFTSRFYLVDNHSADDSFPRFKELFSRDRRITLLRTKDNLGYVGGNNFAIRRALKDHCSYILLINNDILADPKFLDRLFAVISADSSIGIVGPKIYFAPGHEFHRHRYSDSERGRVIWSAGGRIDWQNIYCHNIGLDEVDTGQHDFSREVDFLSGCCQLVRAEVFAQIGLLNQDYFMYLEDAEFSQRVKSAGYQVVYFPRSVIWHLNAGSSRAGGGPLHDYFLTRNRLIFGLKYAALRTKFALIRDSLRLIFRGTKWQRKAIFDYYLRRWGRGSWV